MSLVSSNKFVVSLLKDGSTYHARLLSTKTAAQAWNGSQAIPDWSVAANQPIIYLDFMDGASSTTFNPPEGEDPQWYYNGTLLTFGANHKSTGTYANLFESTSYNNQPALKILNNLANGSNVDVDTITFVGNHQNEGDTIPVRGTLYISISNINGGTWFGSIEYSKQVLTSESDTATLTGVLYDTNGAANSYKTEWYLNGSLKQTKSAGHTCTISGSDFNDYAVIECKFYATIDGAETLVWTAVGGLDDEGDPDVMVIESKQGTYTESGGQYTVAGEYGTGGDTAIRSNEAVNYQFWMAKREELETSILTGNVHNGKVRILKADGTLYTGNVAPIPNVDQGDENGWRTVDFLSTPKKFNLVITADNVNTLEGSLTGVISIEYN